MNIPPKQITDLGLNLLVNTEKLRPLPIQEQEFRMEDLVWHLDIPVWAKDGTDDWNLTPRNVIDKTEGSAGHYERMMKSDTQFPLLLRRYNERLVIVDGVHRLTKLFLEGKDSVKAKLIPEGTLLNDEYKS